MSGPDKAFSLEPQGQAILATLLRGARICLSSFQSPTWLTQVGSEVSSLLLQPCLLYTQGSPPSFWKSPLPLCLGVCIAVGVFSSTMLRLVHRASQ